MFKVTTLNGTEVLDTEVINDIEDLSLIRRTREKIAAHFAVSNTPYTANVGGGYSVRVEFLTIA